MPKLNHPVVITTPKAKAQLVREAASQYGVQFTESAIPGQEDLLRFTFVPLDEATTAKLAAALSPEAYAYSGKFIC